MDKKEQILQFRARITIGLMEARELLEASNWDLESAIQKKKSDLISGFVKSARVDADLAESKLENCGWDLEKALADWEDSNKNLFERILNSSKNPETVMSNVFSLECLIHPNPERYNVGGWLLPEDFRKMPKVIAEALRIWQWLELLELEGVGLEQKAALEAVLELEKHPPFRDLAGRMRMAIESGNQAFFPDLEAETLKRKSEILGALVSTLKTELPSLNL